MTVEIRLRGFRSEPDATEAQRLSAFRIQTHETVDTADAHRGGGDQIAIAADDRDVLQVEFDDGFVDFLTVEQARERAATSRTGADGSFDFPMDLGGQTTRGALNWIVSNVRRFSFKPPSTRELMDVLTENGFIQDNLIEAGANLAADVLARAIALWVEREFWTKAQPAGVYHVNDQLDLFQQMTDSAQVGELRRRLDDPYLVLIHGTFSNTANAFQHLGGTREWNEIHHHYRGRVLALEHKTLSKNPVQNALDLVSKLPPRARLHVISHSRGGLVGDLLSLPALSAGSREAFRKVRDGDEARELGDIEQLLDLTRRQDIKVERFVRIASPAAGTILASKRTDNYLKIIFNLLKHVPPVGAHPIFPMVEALTLALVGKKADPDLMPGLEAMMPRSPYIHLLNSSSQNVNDGLAVVAGDVEGSGIVRRIKVFAADLFYREDHDLVVDTKSMYLGLKRDKAVASYQKTSQIDHMTYFKNDVTRRRIVNALFQDEPRGFQPLVSPSAGVTVDNVTRARKRHLPRVVLIPAQLASGLARGGGTTVWPDAIADAGVAVLESTLVATTINGPLYQGLTNQLAQDFVVEPFAFDWRKSCAETGKLLETRINQLLKDDTSPVHIVAHSGGGFAPLWLKAQDNNTWKRLRDRGGRLVLLGLPWRGSFSVLSWLTGRGPLVSRLALLDPTLKRECIGQLLAALPGLVELLPRTPDADFLDSEAWRARGLIAPKHLEAARTQRDAVERACGGDGVSLIAGQGTPTLVDVGRDKLESFRSLAGDGFVSRELGTPDDADIWFARTSHDGLVGATQADVVRDLLRTGSTDRLDREPEPVPAAAEALQDESPVLFPTRNDLVLSGLGEEPEETTPADKWTMRVEVLHGSLEYADYPILVGHYEGTPIDGAEGFLDRQLNGRLTNRQVLGRYPERIGDSEVIPGAGDMKGAIIVGMGPIGELSQPRLRQSVTEAALAYALQMMDRDRDDESSGPRSAAFAAVLVGTNGRHGITLEASIAAIVQAAVEANEILQQAEFREQVRIDCVQFIDLYGDTAEDAASIVRDAENVPAADSNDQFLVEPAQILREVKGGRPGRPGREYQAGSWSRLVIKSPKEAEDGNPQLEFTSLGRRARAELFKESFEQRNIEDMIRKAVRSRQIGPTNNTLFELLVPNEFKHEIRDGGNRVLVVDQVSASYPWEMLAIKDRAGSPQPLVAQLGILRQLSLPRPRATIRGPRGMHALVIGDPHGGKRFPPLDAARREAKQVAATLRAHGYDVKELIASHKSTPGWLEIEDALFARDYRIVHVAAHGAFDEQDPNASGVVIGPDRYLTANVIRKLPVVPEFVFLNCCHLGRTSRSRRQKLDGTRSRLNQLAATLSTQLMEIGVRAVVAAGWAVDDCDAATFATALYTNLFRGSGFGSAVQDARKIILDAGRSNTWGAYQCYGDPGYRCYRDTGFRHDTRPASSRTKMASKPPVSQRELVRTLKEVATRVGDYDARRGSLLDQLGELERATPQHWRSGEVEYSFGVAFSEVRCYEKAIEYYRAALNSWDAEAPMKLLEQLSNMEVRYALQLDRGPDAKTHSNQIKGLLDDAKDLLKRVQAAYSETPESWALVGSYHKKNATTLERSAQNPEIKRSQESYHKAHEIAVKAGKPQPYQTVNWITMSKLLGSVPPEEKALLHQTVQQLRKERDKLRQDADFWNRVALPDALLANALVKETLPQDADEITRLYDHAFTTRSTFRERGSVLEHLGDLMRLIPDLAKDLAKIEKRLGNENE